MTARENKDSSIEALSANAVLVTMLGPPTVTLQDIPIKFRYKKAEAVLYFLAFERQRVARARIAELLWPNSDAGDAAKNLRVVLNDLRDKLGDRVISDASTPFLDLQRVHSDVDLIEPRNHLPSDEGALDTLLMTSREFLEGFDVDKAPTFDMWREQANAVLHERLHRLRSRRAEVAMQRGDLDGAFALLDANLAHEPWDEGLLRRVVRLAVRKGDRGAALRRTQRTIIALREEFDAEPQSDTLSLRDALLAQTSERTLDPPECVGHLTLHESLDAWLEQNEGSSHVLTLSGPPGIGKSLFAHTVLRQALHEPVTAKCIIDAKVASDDRDFKERLTGAVAHAKQARAHPLVFVDNMPEKASWRAVLADVVRATPQVKWLLTSRTPLRIPEESALFVDPLQTPNHDVVHLIPNVSSVVLFRMISQQLNPSRSWNPAEERILTRWIRRTGGHPAAIITLAKHAAEAKDLPRLDAGPNHASSLLPLDDLRTMFTDELARLSPTHLQALTVLARFEAGASIDEISRCFANTSVQTQDFVQLEKSGWIQQAPTMDEEQLVVAPWAYAFLRNEATHMTNSETVTTAFAHCIVKRIDLLAPKLNGPVDEEAANRVVAMLGDVLDAYDALADSDPAGALRLAHTTWPVFRRAGRAMELTYRVEPLVNAHAASLDVIPRSDALFTLANLYILEGRFADALPLHEQACELRDAHGDVKRSARSRLNLAQVYARVGDLPKALSTLQEGERLAREANDAWTEAACLSNSGHVHRALGDTDAAIPAYQAGLVVLQSIGDTMGALGIRMGYASALTAAGERAIVVEEIHQIDIALASLPAGRAHNLARPLRVLGDEVAQAGWLQAAEVVDRIARKHGLMHGIKA